MSSDASVRTPHWCLVVPVKGLRAAKTRLSDPWSAAGSAPGSVIESTIGSPVGSRAAVSATTREELALAFTLDTISAAVHCREVRAVIVVTDDPRVTGALTVPVQESLSVDPAEVDLANILVVPDLPAAGLNAALRHGAAVALGRHPSSRVGAVSADLPALRPDELGMVLRAADDHEVAMVADWHGAGTTVLLARSSAMFKPSFGVGSRARHVADGAVVLGDDMASVRVDVDTVADLHAALLLGVGAATRAQAQRLIDFGGAAWCRQRALP